MEKCALNHSFWSRITVLLKQMIFQRTGVNANPDRNSFFLTSLNAPLYPFPTTDVARINPYLVDAVLNSQQCQTIIKMNVRDKRNMNALLNLFNCFSGFLVIDGNPNKLAARFLKSQYFSDSRFHVSSLGRTHTLYNNLVAA